jgi:hypothetical protein
MGYGFRMRSSEQTLMRFGGKASAGTPRFLVALAGALALAGCKKPTSAEATAEQVLTEEGDDGTITWDIEPDGRVHAALAGPDGHAITKNIAGRLTWPGDVADQDRELKLEDGALVASGPPLQDDLTEIDYALEVEGKTWAGVLHMPKGGTRALDEDAKQAAATIVPAGKVGPNGGAIQIIGGQPYELVADAQTQEVRFYLLDSEYNAIDPGDRTVRVGYGADYPGVEVLVREPGALYFVGPWYAGYNPFRVTVAVGFGGVVHVGVMGWRYGERARFGVGAPAVGGFVAVRGWAPSVAVRAGVGFGVGFGVGVGVGGRARVGAGATAGAGGPGGGGREGRGPGGERGGAPAATGHPVDGPNGQGRSPQAQGTGQHDGQHDGQHGGGPQAAPTGGRQGTPAPTGGGAHEEPRTTTREEPHARAQPAAPVRPAPRPAAPARPAPRPAPRKPR